MLRTDNTLKNVKNDVPLFCTKNEIIHQTSCSHTSQQNGIIERNILNVRYRENIGCRNRMSNFENISESSSKFQTS